MFNKILNKKLKIDKNLIYQKNYNEMKIFTYTKRMKNKLR